MMRHRGLKKNPTNFKTLFLDGRHLLVERCGIWNGLKLQCNMVTTTNQLGRFKSIVGQKGAELRRWSVHPSQRLASWLERIRSEAARSLTVVMSPTSTTGWESPDLSTHLRVLCIFSWRATEELWGCFCFSLSCTLARQTAWLLESIDSIEPPIVWISPGNVVHRCVRLTLFASVSELSICWPITALHTFTQLDKT